MAFLRLAARVGGGLGPGAAWVGCHEADAHDPCIDMAACERAVVRRWRQQAEGASSSYGQRGAAWYWLDRELSSDVAGETGAVCIYKGAVAALRWRGHDEASSDSSSDGEDGTGTQDQWYVPASDAGGPKKRPRKEKDAFSIPCATHACP